jgi:DNA helicase-2/ATP-dependent DNA helicase PcrA
MSTIAAPKHTPSVFQQAVYDFVQHGKGNAVISAVAGSGKTTTVLNCIKMVPARDTVLYVAFSKEIVKETKEKIDLPNLTVKTLHSFGMNACTKGLPDMLKHEAVDNRKYDKILKAVYSYLTSDLYEAIEPFGLSDGDKDLLKKTFAIDATIEDQDSYDDRIVKLCALGRMNLAKSLEEMEELAEKHDVEIINGECIRALMLMQLGAKYTRVIDYTDMIFLPIFLNLSVDKYMYVFVDEAQDLNAAQRELMLKAVHPKGRFVAVGDENQAIFGFAGADIDSYSKLAGLPNTVELPLSVCYRCGSDIVAKAQTIVPHILSAPGAITGTVDNEASKWTIQDGDMVLCRNTYPLVKMCLWFLKRGIKAYVRGSDVGAQLAKMITSTKAKTMEKMFDKLYHELDLHKRKLMLKKRITEQEAEDEQSYMNMVEKIEIIEFMSVGASDPAEVVEKIKAIFKDDQTVGISLSSIHKSKGLEANRVYIIHPEKMPSFYAKKDWQKVQEENLRYVCYTRAKHYLGTVIDFDAYGDRQDESRAEQVKPVVVSKFVGTVGSKHPCELTIVDIREMNSHYGDANLYTMEDKSGNIFTKWGEISERFIVSETKELAIGTTVRFMGTIKEHKAYKGVNTNVISHIAKLDLPKEPKKKKAPKGKKTGNPLF